MAVILQIIPYSIFPPRNGGQLRCFHILKQLAREHEVHVIILQPQSELRGERDGCAFPGNVTIYGPAQTPPPRTLFDLLPKRLNVALHYRWLRRSWRGPAEGILLSIHHLLKDMLPRVRMDLVIFESLSAMTTSPLLRRLSPHTVQVLDAHNVDHKLMRPEENQKIYDMIRWRETHLAETVDAFFACSNLDKIELEKLNGNRIKGFTIPNGVDMMAMPYDENPGKAQQKKILYCGNLNYPPHKHGLEWFHRIVWPLIRAREPHLRLVVVGIGATPGDYAAMRADPSVEFVGEVDNVVPYHHATSLAIVPLFEGSGTRLKIPTAMSLGSPVVSTRIGAEGIEVEHGREILLADKPEEFAAAVLRLLVEPDLFESLRRNARRLVADKYDWGVIGRGMNGQIKQLTAKRISQ
jgi:glycosyltransferase involved in cell wall biosynthesis